MDIRLSSLLFDTILEILAYIISQWIKATDWKGRNKTVYLQKHGYLHRKSQRIYEKPTRTNMWVLQGQGLQGQYKNNCIFM